MTHTRHHHPGRARAERGGQTNGEGDGRRRRRPEGAMNNSDGSGEVVSPYQILIAGYHLARPRRHRLSIQRHPFARDLAGKPQ